MDTVLFPSTPILIVDDDLHILKSYEMVLRSAGITNIIACSDSREVIPHLSHRKIDLILLDLAMPYLSGEEILTLVGQYYPDISVIVITGFDEVETAVRCMKSGAVDYIVKPMDPKRLISCIHHAMDVRDLRSENTRMKQLLLEGTLEHPEYFAEIITNNKTMFSLFQYLETIAKTSQPVLITGETGVGKERFAQTIHLCSQRNGPLISVNVAGLDDNIISDSLFGHKKGAFTGADHERNGFLEQAAGGTLFLDEIGDLSETSQVKLLRLLQEREYFPLGSDLPKWTNARFIFSTHQNLTSLMKSGTFRKDLYYRLRTHHIQIPPLRERKDDISLLFEYFLAEACKEFEKTIPTYPPQLSNLLATYHYPGNIRELRSIVFEAVSHHQSKILSMNIFANYFQADQQTFLSESIPENHENVLNFPDQLPTLKQTSQLLIDEALRRTNGNQSMAAKLLGITRQALNRRLKNQS